MNTGNIVEDYGIVSIDLDGDNAVLPTPVGDRLPARPSIAAMEPCDRPFEKAWEFGCSTLCNADLWALILRTGQPGAPITDICREITRKSGGTLHNLERRTRQELMEIKGIGQVKAIQIEAVMQLIRNYLGEKSAELPKISGAADVHKLMVSQIGNLPHEEIWALYLTRQNKVKACCSITRGTSTASLLDLKKILKHAILENAEALILCHNHPSGAIHPSVPDDNITRQVKNACATLDLRLLDHVIVTADGYYSYSDHDRI